MKARENHALVVRIRAGRTSDWPDKKGCAQPTHSTGVDSHLPMHVGITAAAPRGADQCRTVRQPMYITTNEHSTRAMVNTLVLTVVAGRYQHTQSLTQKHHTSWEPTAIFVHSPCDARRTTAARSSQESPVDWRQPTPRGRQSTVDSNLQCSTYGKTMGAPPTSGLASPVVSSAARITCAKTGTVIALPANEPMAEGGMPCQLQAQGSTPWRRQSSKADNRRLMDVK